MISLHDSKAQGYEHRTGSLLFPLMNGSKVRFQSPVCKNSAICFQGHMMTEVLRSGTSCTLSKLLMA